MSTPAHPTPACSPSCVLLRGADTWRGPLGDLRGVREVPGPNDYRAFLAARWFVICPEEETRA